MFKNDRPAATASVPAERISSIAAKTPLVDYCDAGGPGKRAPRQQVFNQTVAIVPNGEKLPIAVKSRSATGLRVEYFQNRSLPETMIINEPSVLLRFQAELVWQGDRAAGLRIVRKAADDE